MLSQPNLSQIIWEGEVWLSSCSGTEFYIQFPSASIIWGWISTTLCPKGGHEALQGHIRHRGAHGKPLGVQLGTQNWVYKPCSGRALLNGKILLHLGAFRNAEMSPTQV